MAQGRWYPSQVLLPDGRQVIIQGSIQEASTQVTPPVEQIINKTIQVFNPPATRGGQGTLTTLAGELGGPGMPPLGDLYPNLRVMPSGRTLVAGPDENDSWYMNTPGTTNGSPLSWEDIDDPDRRRLYGNAVFEPPPPGSTAPSDRVIQLGGRISASDTTHESDQYLGVLRRVGVGRGLAGRARRTRWPAPTRTPSCCRTPRWCRSVAGSAGRNTSAATR